MRFATLSFSRPPSGGSTAAKRIGIEWSTRWEASPSYNCSILSNSGSYFKIGTTVRDRSVWGKTHRLVHRDIKPSNLMLVRESDGTLRVKVIDFGLAKFV